MVRKRFSLALFTMLFFLSVTLGYQAGKIPVFKEAEPSYLRLHVVAHSDEPRDQVKKLAVRDFILEEFSYPFANLNCQQDALDYTFDLLPFLEARITQFLQSQDYSMAVQAQLVKEQYPGMVYGELMVPEGEYWSLKVVLGEGQGQNWWCVLYPPLCFMDLREKAQPVTTGKKMEKPLLEAFKSYPFAGIKKTWLTQ